MDKTDLIVLNAFRSHKLSSAEVIAKITKLPQRDVDSSVSRLLEKRKIYQSVGGVPRRYNTSDFTTLFTKVVLPEERIVEEPTLE